MKSIEEIRRHNLLSILENEFDSRAELAAALGVQPNVISRTLNVHAKDHRNIGASFARSIEKRTGKPPFWMDSPHSTFEVTEAGATYEPQDGIDSVAVEFALGVLDLAMEDPEFKTEYFSMDWRVKVFKKMYKHRHSLDAAPPAAEIRPLLRLVS